MADDSNWIRILEMGHDAAKVMWKITKFMYSKFHLRSIIMRIIWRLDANSRYSSNFVSLELWVNCIYWSFQLFFLLILGGNRRPILKSSQGHHFHSPLTYCRQRFNMEIDASLSILRACPTISNKHFLLECRMKGHLHLRMEELLQPVDTLGMWWITNAVNPVQPFYRYFLFVYKSFTCTVLLGKIWEK